MPPKCAHHMITILLIDSGADYFVFWSLLSTSSTSQISNPWAEPRRTGAFFRQLHAFDVFHMSSGNHQVCSELPHYPRGARRGRTPTKPWNYRVFTMTQYERALQCENSY